MSQENPFIAACDRLFSAALALPDVMPKLSAEAGPAEVEQASITIRMEYTSFDGCWQPLLGGQGPVGTYVARTDQ